MLQAPPEARPSGLVLWAVVAALMSSWALSGGLLLRGHRFGWLRFREGRSGEVDLTHAMNGPVFEPLHDIEFFRQFRVHPEWETLVWPNGADMAPEFLYAHVRVAA